MNASWTFQEKPIRVDRRLTYYLSVNRDGERFVIGDCVSVHSDSSAIWVAIVEELYQDQEGEERCLLRWFTHVDDMHSTSRRPDALPNEIYISSTSDENYVQCFLSKVAVMSPQQFAETYPRGLSTKELRENRVFVCRYGFHLRTAKYTHDPFVWEDVWKDRNVQVFDKFLEAVGPIRSAVRRTVAKRRRDSDTDATSSSEKEERVVRTPRKRRTKSTPNVTPRMSRTPRTPGSKTPRRIIKKPLEITPLPTRIVTDAQLCSSPYEIARAKLHVSAIPESLPCRELEFSQILTHLEDAIYDGSGTCIYVSGTPGTGKTATVHEVIARLHAQVDAGELDYFTFVEINGMKIADPNQAYALLWEALSEQRLAPAHACALLESEFSKPSPRRVPCVVLMDELDQLVTKNQKIMYNFFNWPSLRHSHLIVIAVANTMDLPERTLSNKISSRLGLHRITFPGYTRDQLVKIIETRLLAIRSEGIVNKDAITFTSAKIAAVSGDARRALDICRRAVEIAEAEAETMQEVSETPSKTKQYGIVTPAVIRKALEEATSSPIYSLLKATSLVTKIYLAALLARMRRSGILENKMADIMYEAERLCTQSNDAVLRSLCDTVEKRGRMPGLSRAALSLAENGIIVIDNKGGERNALVKLLIGDEEVRSALHNDSTVTGLF